MIRRARLSFKPNVRPGGRASAGGGGARDGGEAAAEGDSPNAGAPERPESASTIAVENQPSTPASTPIQRRKRISTLPNLAKPRVSGSAAVTPSQKCAKAEAPPSLPVSSVPSLDVVSPPETAKVASAPKSPASAAINLHGTLPEKRNPLQVPPFSPPKKDSAKESEIGLIKSVVCTKEEFTPLKERPPLKSSPNEDVIKDIPKKLVAAGHLERERVRRAQKLRELLRDELRKERKIWKAKHPVLVNENEIERSKMTMRDFIYFIPTNNPMTSSFEEPKTTEKTLTDSQVTGPPVKNMVNDDEEEIEEEENEDQLLVPRVKVAEDGSIILDEESLTVEVSRSKEPIVEGNDPIFERGSTTTYSSFRKNNYSKPWSEEETNMFFLAISMVGTDFSMISQLFPHRERIEIKNKFKREERANGWRIDKAFRKLFATKEYIEGLLPKNYGLINQPEEKQAFDLEFFAKRLEKALEKKQKTPRIKKPREKNAAKPRKKKEKKAVEEEILSDGEISILSDEDDARIEEKENEEALNAKECLLASDKVRRKKRKTRKKNELEEENRSSQDEEISQVPHKETKPRKKGKASAQSQDSSELVNGSLEEIQDSVPEKEKKTKRSRKKQLIAGSEENGNGDIIASKSPSRNSGNSKSDLPDNADGNSQIHSEAEAQESAALSQSEAHPYEEGSSLLIFNEESAALSGLSGLDLSSLQECLNEVPVTQSSLVVPNNTSDYDNDDYNDIEDDDVVETCAEESILKSSGPLVSDYSKQVLLEDDIAMEIQIEKAVEDEEAIKFQDEQNITFAKPATPTRGRFQKPKPNIPGKPMARQEKVQVTEKMALAKKGNGFAAEDATTLSHSDTEENLDNEKFPVSGAERNLQGASPPSVQKDCGTNISQSLIVASDTANEDSEKDRAGPLVRGRFRPKPNLTKASVKNKPSPESVPNSQDDGHVPCSVAGSPLCIPVEEKELCVTAKTELSTSLLDDGTTSSPKPAPLSRGRFQRPKPNVMRAGRKEKSDDKGASPEVCARNTDAVTPEDTNSHLSVNLQKNAGSDNYAIEENTISEDKVKPSDPSTIVNNPVPEPLDTTHEGIAEMELVPTVGSQKQSSAVSQHDGKISRIKPAPLIRGRLQRPKPNLITPSILKENEEEMSSNKTIETTEASLGSKLEKPGIQKMFSEEQLDFAVAQEDISETNPQTISVVKEESSPSVVETQKSPRKSAPLTRRCLQRPKPNLKKAPKCTDTKANGGAMSVENGVSADFKKEVPSFEESVSHQENCRGPAETHPDLPKEPQKSVSLTGPPKPAVLGRGRFQKPKPNLVQLLDEKDAIKTVSGGKINEEKPSKSEQLPKCDEPGSLSAHAEDFVSPEQTRSYVLSLETIGFTNEHETDNEGSCSMYKKLSPSDAEKISEPPKPLARSRFQGPKPNLSRSLTQPVVSNPQICDVHDEGKIKEERSDASYTENNDPDITLATGEDNFSQIYPKGTRLLEAACNGEPAKGPSVKPVRNRLQKPKPNLGLASMKKKSSAVEPGASVQKKGRVEKDSKIPEIIEIKDSLEIAITKDAENSSSSEEKPAHSSIEAAPLRCKKPVRPSLVGPPSKKPSQAQSKASDEDTACSADKACDLLTSSSSPGGKRKSTGCFTGVSTKKSRQDQSECSSSSESELEDIPSTREQPDNVPDENKQQISRFGRHLKRPPATKPPISCKSSASSLERPEKEKPSRSVKPNKNKVAKSVSKAVKPGKTTLVKLRATQEEEDDVEDAEADLEEHYDPSPEKLNQAPVFVPFSLRSPKPVPAEIEETVEELEIPLEDIDAPGYTDQNLVRSPHLILHGVPPHLPVLHEEQSKDAHYQAGSKLPSDTARQNSLALTGYTDTQRGEVLLENCKQSSAVAEQMSCSSIEEHTQQPREACHDIHVPENLLENESPEEATFILTLVEIPFDDDYSCDVSSDPPPAPVLVTSDATHVMAVPQSESLDPTVMPPSYEPPSAVQEQTDLPVSQYSRKRSASGLSEENAMQPSKKALVCNHQQGEDNQPKSTVVEENSNASFLADDQKTEESFESSINNLSSADEEKFPEHTASGHPGTSVGSDEHETANVCTLNRNVAEIANTSSPSGTTLQRPGRKPLGFLPLVCKDKLSKKTNKNITKTKRKNVPSFVQKREEQVPADDQEQCLSTTEPSQPSSCVIEVAPVHEPKPLESQASDADGDTPEESPKPHELSSEEDASQVSQFFFSDIFMEVDD